MDIVEALRATSETGADLDVILEAADEIERLRDALRKVAQSHAWHLFGERQSFGSDTPRLMSREADALAKKVLTPNAVAEPRP